MSAIHNCICLYMKADKAVTHEQRKKYISALCGDYLGHKLGFVRKFNNAIGYKAVVDDYISDPNGIINAKVEVGEEYNAPQRIILENMHADFTKFGVVKFVVPVMHVECKAAPEYSYDTEEIMQKFAKYLQKVFPQMTITMEKKNRVSTTLRSFALDWFYQGMDITGNIPYTVEFSAHRMLNDDEVNSIMKVLKKAFKYPFKISQHWCETCAEHDKDHPYHIEIEYC